MVALTPFAIMVILPIIIAVVSILGTIVNKVVIANLKSPQAAVLKYAFFARNRPAEVAVPVEPASQPPSPDFRREPESRDSSPSIRRSIMSGKSTRDSMASFEKASLEVFEREDANSPDKSSSAKIFAFLQGLPLPLKPQY